MADKGIKIHGSVDATIVSGLIPEVFDYVGVTYVASGNGEGEVETATYKSGGSGGDTVAVLTIAYDSSDRISSITRT